MLSSHNQSFFSSMMKAIVNLIALNHMNIGSSNFSFDSSFTILLCGMVALISGCGDQTTAQNQTDELVAVTQESCELCRTPGSRASFLLAAAQEGQFVANIQLLDKPAIAKALAEKIIGPDLALEEVRVFNETRVPDMPRVRTAVEWNAKAVEIRKNVLDNVVFRGGAAQWRNTPLKVEWGDTFEGLPGYRIKKLKFEALPGWWIPALLYEPENIKGKVPVVMNVNGHARTGKATDYKQLRCINLVKRGMVVLNPEWIGMGQFANRMGHYQMNSSTSVAPPASRLFIST